MSCFDKNFDFIIVGAGTAGCALAKKLSKKFSVLLIEHGIFVNDDPSISIPSNNGTLVLQHTNEFFWGLGHATGVGGQRNPAVAGDVLGGGSTVNGMQYVRGTKQQFNTVSQNLGDPDWGCDNVLNIYKKIEKFNGVPDQFNPNIHGFKGPLDIRQAVGELESAKIFQNAMANIDEPIPPFPDGDYNDVCSPLTTGSFLYWQLTQTPEKIRESSNTAYLDKILRKKSRNIYVSCNKKYQLTMFTKTFVKKVIIDKSCCKPKAEGVKILFGGHCCHSVYANKEVILCTGFQSSKLLELSGIGDKEILNKNKIKTIYNNSNVGRNLLNHPVISLLGTGTENQFGIVTDEQGLYSGGAEIDGVDGERRYQLIGIPVGAKNFLIANVLLVPESKGEIHIQSSDPTRMPLFNFNYFDPNTPDLDNTVIIYKTMYKILVQMNLTPQGPPIDDDDAIKIYILTSFSQAYHWTGACRMANSSSEGVTNSNGEVFGVDDLRVSDIFIFPINPRGNTQALAYLIGNIIAKKILRKYKC